MKKFFIVFITCIALTLSSCGISQQATSNRNVTQTNVILSQNNFKVIGTVSGQSVQKYWFGLGGLSKKSLGESAMAEMYQNANLKGSQAIINVNVCYKNKFILIYNEAKVTATGTLIQFVDNNQEPDTPNQPLTSNGTEDGSIAEEDKAVVSPINENTVSTNSNRVTEDTKENYVLVYMRKKKFEEKWIIEKQEDIYTTYTKAKKIAEKWNKKTSSIYDFNCNVSRNRRK